MNRRPPQLEKEKSATGRVGRRHCRIQSSNEVVRLSRHHRTNYNFCPYTSIERAALKTSHRVLGASCPSFGRTTSTLMPVLRKSFHPMLSLPTLLLKKDKRNSLPSFIQAARHSFLSSRLQHCFRYPDSRDKENSKS